MCWGLGGEAAAPRQGLGRGRRDHRPAPAPALGPRWGGARASPAPPCPRVGVGPRVGGDSRMGGASWVCRALGGCGPGRRRSSKPGPPRTGLWKRAGPEETPGAPSPPPPRGQAPLPPVTPSSLLWRSCCASSAGGAGLGASRTPHTPAWVGGPPAGAALGGLEMELTRLGQQDSLAGVQAQLRRQLLHPLGAFRKQLRGPG